ncbi:MAG TPA: condensation domain-containing protein, partial [Candidatus Obscuribacterales bacterium]
MGLRNIPNARVQHAVQASELLANSADQVQPDSLTALHETLTQWDASGYEPEDFWQLGETLNCRVKVCVSRAPDCFSVLLSQTDMLDVFQNAKSEDFTPDALMGFANHPVRGKVSARLVPRLKAALAEKLPEYMVPGHFVILDRFPLTPNGKSDRKALPDPDKSREQAGSEYVAHSTPEQSLLCELFAEVLELDRVGIHDNFFDLGGHSLLATQLAARIRERLQVELPLRKLFEAPTVAELAASVQELRGQTLARIGPAPQGIPLRLSLSQELWWFLFPRRADLEHGIQNSYAGIRLAGELDVPALEQSLQQIIARHESLRTTFAKIETRPVRVVHPKLPFNLSCLDLTDLNETQAIRQLQQEAELPFNLETGPLIRASVYKVSARMHFFMFSVSHIVFDGWSLKIMLKELDSLYACFAAGRDAGLPPLPVQYSDYVHWHRGWIKKTAMKQQLFYWLMKGRNMPVVLDLPTDKPRPRELTLNGGSVGFVLDEALTGAVR